MIALIRHHIKIYHKKLNSKIHRIQLASRGRANQGIASAIFVFRPKNFIFTPYNNHWIISGVSPLIICCLTNVKEKSNTSSCKYLLSFLSKKLMISIKKPSKSSVFTVI